MNFGPLLFLGIFLTFASAWIGLVFMPSATLRDVKATAPEGSTVANPRPYTGDEHKGRAVYVREGCVYCHSQQVRGGHYNNDLERGWGTRRSSPQDYIYDYPVLLGTARNGPDLVNIGARQTNDNWHHTHLYDPQLIVPGSIMAPHPFLYEVRPAEGGRRPDALQFNFVYVTLKDGDESRQLEALKAAGFTPILQRGGRWAGSFDPAKAAELLKVTGVEKAEPYVPADKQIVPTQDARNLVAFLKSLDRTYPVEMPGTK
jgi:cytochrome c oxidase cbb3-type subunit 2